MLPQLYHIPWSSFLYFIISIKELILQHKWNCKMKGLLLCIRSKGSQITQTSGCTLISFWLVFQLLSSLSPSLESIQSSHQRITENKLVTIKATFCWFWGWIWMRRMKIRNHITKKARTPILQGSKLAMKWIPYVMKTLKIQIKEAIWKTKLQK